MLDITQNVFTFGNSIRKAESEKDAINSYIYIDWKIYEVKNVFIAFILFTLSFAYRFLLNLYT